MVANAIDLGDATSPLGNVHPRNKTAVGQRLAAGALVACVCRFFSFLHVQSKYHTIHIFHDSSVFVNICMQALQYGQDVEYLYPAYASASSSDAFGTLVVTVQFTVPVGGLVINASTCPSDVPASECGGVEVQSSDGQWHPLVAIKVVGRSAVEFVLATPLPAVQYELLDERVSRCVFFLFNCVVSSCCVESLRSADGLPRAVALRPGPSSLC